VISIVAAQAPVPDSFQALAEVVNIFFFHFHFGIQKVGGNTFFGRSRSSSNTHARVADSSTRECSKKMRTRRNTVGDSLQEIKTDGTVNIGTVNVVFCGSGSGGTYDTTRMFKKKRT